MGGASQWVWGQRAWLARARRQRRQRWAARLPMPTSRPFLRPQAWCAPTGRPPSPEARWCARAWRALLCGTATPRTSAAGRTWVSGLRGLRGLIGSACVGARLPRGPAETASAVVCTRLAEPDPTPRHPPHPVHPHAPPPLGAARDDVAVITANPKTAGVARWIFLALWGARLSKGKKEATKYVTKVGAGAGAGAGLGVERRASKPGVGSAGVGWRCKPRVACARPPPVHPGSCPPAAVQPPHAGPRHPPLCAALPPACRCLIRFWCSRATRARPRMSSTAR